MAAKTGQKIVSDVIALLHDTTLESSISGKIYRIETRPRDSKKEDCTVGLLTADADQFQTGVVTLNIFVPDIYATKTGVSYINSARCEELEGVAANIVESLKVNNKDYRFTLRSAIYTEHDAEIRQSFVVVKLLFKYI